MKFALGLAIQAALVAAALAQRPTDGGEAAALREALAKKDGELQAERARSQELEAQVQTLEGRVGFETQKEFSLESRLALIRSALADEPAAASQPLLPIQAEARRAPAPLAPSASAAEVLDADEDEAAQAPKPAPAAPVSLHLAHGRARRDLKADGLARLASPAAKIKRDLEAKTTFAAKTASAAKEAAPAAKHAAPPAASPGQDADLDALDSQLKEEEKKMQELNSASMKPKAEAPRAAHEVVAAKPPQVVAAHLGRVEVPQTTERALEQKHDVMAKKHLKNKRKEHRHVLRSAAALAPPVEAKPLAAAPPLPPVEAQPPADADDPLDGADAAIKAAAPPPAASGVLKASIGAPLTQEGDVSSGLDADAQRDDQAVAQLTEDKAAGSDLGDAPLDDADLQ